MCWILNEVSFNSYYISITLNQSTIKTFNNNIIFLINNERNYSQTLPQERL